MTASPPGHGRPGPFRLVFADIDGTLVGATGCPSQRVLTVLHRIQTAGCILVLCTGRSRYAAEQAAEQIGRTGYGIVMNGALIFEWKTGALIRQSLLAAETVRKAAGIAYERGMAPIWLGVEDFLVADRIAPLWLPYETRNRARIRFVSELTSGMPGKPASLAAYGLKDDALALAADWHQHLGASVTSVAGPTAVYGGWYAQLTTAEAEKGCAAAYLAHHLNIAREQTIAIGDHVNDIGLLVWSGWGVCMGDGNLEARAAADYVTGSLAQDGAASALERFVLRDV